MISNVDEPPDRARNYPDLALVRSYFVYKRDSAELASNMERWKGCLGAVDSGRMSPEAYKIYREMAKLWGEKRKKIEERIARQPYVESVCAK